MDGALRSIQTAARSHASESFRIAKSRVVDTFERDYIHAALSHHAGNVARAARASSKHRRAFWALMRKHHIDATPYRLQRYAADSAHSADATHSADTTDLEPLFWQRSDE